MGNDHYSEITSWIDREHEEGGAGREKWNLQQQGFTLQPNVASRSARYCLHTRQTPKHAFVHHRTPPHKSPRTQQRVSSCFPRLSSKTTAAKTALSLSSSPPPPVHPSHDGPGGVRVHGQAGGAGADGLAATLLRVVWRSPCLTPLRQQRSDSDSPASPAPTRAPQPNRPSATTRWSRA